MIILRLASLAAAMLLAACTVGSPLYLMDSGYSINPIDGDSEGYAIEVHANQLKQLGGDVTSARFRLFAAERLKWHGLCPVGWRPLPCVQDGSCLRKTHHSVIVNGRCVTP